MSEVETRDKAAEGVAIWPMPASAQQGVGESERDEAIARAAGAEQDEKGRWILPETARSTPAGRRVERKFGTRTARRNFEKATSQVRANVGDDRMVMARAANAEVVAQGGVPVRDVPEATPEGDQRTYFYTARENDSPYHFRKLDKLAKAEGVTLLIDRDRTSETYGLRYVAGDAPAALAQFRTDDAYEAHRASRARATEEKARMAAAANTMAPADSKREMPLAVPDPEADYEGFKQVRARIRETGSSQLERLIDVTRAAHEDLLEREDAMAVQKRAVPSDKVEERNCYERGMILAQKVLSDRARASDRRAVEGEPSDIRSAQAGRAGREDAHTKAVPGDGPRQETNEAAARKSAPARRPDRRSPDLEQ